MFGSLGGEGVRPLARAPGVTRSQPCVSGAAPRRPFFLFTRAREGNLVLDPETRKSYPPRVIRHEGGSCVNEAAEKHLVKAESYLAKGDGWYEKAADEIIAAQQADPALTQSEIGERFGRSRKWAGDLVAWRTSGKTSSSPYSGTGRPHQDRTATRKMLREAPLEQVEQMIEELPRERKQ